MSEFVWLLNPRGIQVEVATDRRDDLLKNGYKVLSNDEIKVYKEKLSVDIKVVQSQWFYTGYGRVQQILQDNIECNPNSNNLLYFGYPQELQKEEGKKYILITAFESNKIPSEWVPLLNQYDLVLVPSKFCERVFKDAGTQTIVRTMIQGTDNFSPVETKPTENFTFIHYASFADYRRKGWDLVARAFNELFPNSTNGVKLILKSRKHEVEKDISTLPENKNIQIIVQDFNRFEMDMLLAKVNCMVFPSRGEGIGLPPLETMARGIPTIFTDAYGMTEYEEFGNPIQIKEFAPAIYDFPFDGLWVEPDFLNLKEKMFSIYSRYSIHKEKAMEQVPKLKERFGERAMAIKFRNLIQKYVN